MSVTVGNSASLGSQSSTNVATFSTAITVSTGSYIDVKIFYNPQQGSGTETISGVADGTNTYVVAGTVVSSGSRAMTQYVTNAAVTGGTYTVVATFGGGNANQWIIVLTEVQGSGGLDSSPSVPWGQFQTSPGTGTNAITTPSLTPGSEPGMMVATAWNNATTQYMSAGTGFTATTNGGTTSTTSGAVFTEYKNYSSLTAFAGTFTQSASETETMAMATLWKPQTSTPGSLLIGSNQGGF